MGTPRRSPRKPYNESGSGLGRSSTLRNVSQSLRKASVRVVNIMGTERGGGRERLGSDDEGEEVLQDVEIDGNQGFAMSSTNDNRETLPSPRQLPTSSRREEVGHRRLRGRTMCLFGPMSRVRKSMDRDRTQLDGACHIIAYYNKCCRSRYSVRSYSELAQDR